MARLKPTPEQVAALAKEKSFNPVVSSHGYSSAQIFFLQGFPLKDDLLEGRALTGSSEKTITTFLNDNRFSINHTYRSIFIREKLEYSATNPKKLRAALEKIDLISYERMLRDEINEIKPNIIVPLDDIALAAVFPHVNTIRKPKGRKYWVNCYRGSILELREDWQQLLGPENIVRVIPTIGPQLLWADWSARCYINLDFKRIIENCNKRSPIEKPGLVWVAKTYEAFNEFLLRQFIKKPSKATFDIETYGGLITCISFCFDGVEACTVPLNDPDIPSGELALLWQLVARVHRNLIEKNNQNIKYDWTILERFGFILNNVRSDTMLKGALLYPELPKGLDFWTSIYTDISYYKDEGREYNPKFHSRDRLYLYCGYDSLAAHIVATKMDEELETEPRLKELYETDVAPSILIYKDIDRTGLLVDDSQKKKLLEKYDRLYLDNLYQLRDMIGDLEYNPNSPNQVGELLYNNLKLPARRKTDPETGRMSWKTDKDTLDDLLIYHCTNDKQTEIISRQIVCRKLYRVKEYINTPLHPDGTFRGSSNLAGTETGRSSSSKTIDERLRYSYEPKGSKNTRRLGRSLQTITKHGFAIDEDIFDDWESKKIADDIRSMFVPRHNFVFIEGDGSGAEARVVFVLAEDFNGLAAMDQKPKIHAKTAAKFFNIDVNEIRKDFLGNWIPAIPKVGLSYYDIGKRGRHAGNYDMHAFRLSQMTHIPLPECERILNVFHREEPNIRNIFHAQVIQQLRLNRKLVNPNGRQRTFFNELNDKTFKEGFATIPQGTISDLTKFSMHLIKEELPSDWYYRKYRFLVEQHDSLTNEVHKDIKEKFMETFKKVYERPISFRECSLSRDFNLIIPLELSWSETNWLEMKEISI